MLYETLKRPQIASLRKQIFGGEDPDPDPLPFKNYGVHTIKPQLRPWLHPLIENNITIELNYWLLSAYICNLFHTYHPYLEALFTWS